MRRHAPHASFFFISILSCLLLVPLIPSHAQDASSGALRGTVVDSTGSRIGEATVVLVNLANGFRYSIATDVEGRYAFGLLPPGDYTARAIATAMSPQIMPKLHVPVGGSVELDFKLSVAGAKETVTVSGAPPLVDTQPTAISSFIETRAVQELPLDGRRFTDLALMTPGVTQDPRGMTSGSNGDLAFGGIRGYQSSYLVDGADNNNAFFAQARGRYRAPYQFSNEVVQEFRVSSNTYGAELGRAGGAVVNVVTKSGSNQLHGSGFYFLRDSSFGATHPFLDFKPHDQQQQFGFTLGGPIRRNRAFFFVGIDQHIFHVPAIVRFLDGSSRVVPQPASNFNLGDYEASDMAQVFAAANQLSSMAGQYPAKMLGNAGFAKVDVALTPHETLTARVNTSRYWGQNNVFLDPASPLTTFAMSDNGQEQVATETGSLALTSNLSWRIVSHLRAQFSRDLQQSITNSTDPLTRITDVFDGFGRSSLLPRQTREHRLHVTETISIESRRHSLKLGADGLLTWIYNFFPSQSGGEYIFDPIKVNPWTFAPMEGGLELTPLRAYAHGVPKYYMQDFGNFASHPDTNEYAGFLQDTIRVTDHLALSLGGRYDLQTYTKKGLVTNPLWPDSGKVPFNPDDFAPRFGLAYLIGNQKPLVIRAGYGWFYTRIPQIYTSAIATDNGLSSMNLFLDNSNFYDHQIFPQYPNALVNCPATATSCSLPVNLAQFAQAGISSFSPNFKTPKVEQSSVSIEREVAHRLAVGASYMYVHGVDLIRARDVNLPPPVSVQYPVYDSSGVNFLGTYYNVPSFSTWQMQPSFTCPWPPCINPLARPIPQLGAIDVFESAASSIYHGGTLSVRRQMTAGMYFRLAYTYAHAIDDGQDALVAGQPSLVQNSYSPNSERGNSVTDQRHRVSFSWIAEPHPFHRGQDLLSKLFNDWKLAGVYTLGTGRPVNLTVGGDPNQDDNSYNDRLPGVGRNSYMGPDYTSMDLRLTRRLYVKDRLKADFIIESFNLLNHDNKLVDITENGLQTESAYFVKMDTEQGINYYPGHYQIPSSPFQVTNSYPPRQVQLALRLNF
ncbi:MAG TPA: TonB-dependent receptor [Terriglobales bacterium]|nr:TonB-dependent receptor [Terriglobales bacterium]